MAFLRKLLEPLRSHHFRNQAALRKMLCQVSHGRSFWNYQAGLAPGFQISSRWKPSGTGMRGLAACRMESDTTMARVQANIWYRKSKGSSTTSGGMLGQYWRG